MLRQNPNEECGSFGDDHLGDGEAGKSNGGMCFYVNKSGLPMDNYTWERMWDHVIDMHPDGPRIMRCIRDARHLPEVPAPHAPQFFPPDTSTQDRIEAVQKYLQQLQYNHTGTQFFDIKKGRPLCGLMDCAKDMIRESLPIKCLEAVILAIYLTNSLTSVDRFPVSFRSLFKGNVYRHVVLGLHYNGRYGALGLSRREDLMYKPLQYGQLSEMVANFQNSYKKYCHSVDKVKIGLIVPHDAHTYECIQWRALCLNMKKLTHKEMCREIDKFSRQIRKQSSRWQATTNAYTSKPERSRSMSPKKPCIRQPHPPSGPPLKPLKIVAPDNFHREHDVDRCESSDGSCCLQERRKSYSSPFTITEIYDIRI